MSHPACDLIFNVARGVAGGVGELADEELADGFVHACDFGSGDDLFALQHVQEAQRFGKSLPAFGTDGGLELRLDCGPRLVDWEEVLAAIDDLENGFSVFYGHGRSKSALACRGNRDPDRGLLPSGSRKRGLLDLEFIIFDSFAAGLTGFDTHDGALSVKSVNDGASRLKRARVTRVHAHSLLLLLPMRLSCVDRLKGAVRVFGRGLLSSFLECSVRSAWVSMKNANFSLHLQQVRWKYGCTMGRGRKKKTIKMKNRKRQAAKKSRAKKHGDAVRKSRLS